MHHSSTETAAAAGGGGGQPLVILQHKTEDMQCHVAGFDQKKSFAVDSVQLETVDGKLAMKGLF